MIFIIKREREQQSDEILWRKDEKPAERAEADVRKLFIDREGK